MNFYIQSLLLMIQPSAKKINIEGNINFKNVDFTYSHTGIEALKNFNLSIRKGEKIAIIGRTGSGKTTIAQLLLRMYDPTKGTIELEGTDIREIDLKSIAGTDYLCAAGCFSFQRYCCKQYIIWNERWE